MENSIVACCQSLASACFPAHLSLSKIRNYSHINFLNLLSSRRSFLALVAIEFGNHSLFPFSLFQFVIYTALLVDWRIEGELSKMAQDVTLIQETSMSALSDNVG